MSDAFFHALARDAAALYPARDRYARHFAYGKLTRDPVFRRILQQGLIAPGASVLDLGCGQGLLAALLIASRTRFARGEWSRDWPDPPAFDSLRGVDFMERDIERAQAACGAEASFIHGDLRTTEFGAADSIVMLDVLHYVDPAAQRDTLERVRASHRGGAGAVLLRVADKGPGWRFRITEAVDLVAMRLRGHRLARLHSQPAAHWQAQLETLGYRVEAQPMSAGTPFANVLLVARYHPG